jgi:hypothetical protein
LKNEMPHLRNAKNPYRLLPPPNISNCNDFSIIKCSQMQQTQNFH